MGKQRTEFFKKCIIMNALIMIIISCIICVKVYVEDSNLIELYILKVALANIIAIIILYFLWSILKTLEEIRDRNYSIGIEKNKKEEE